MQAAISSGLAGAALVASLAGFWYSRNEVGAVRRELAVTRQENVRLRTDIDTAVQSSRGEITQNLARVNEEVEKARRAALSTANRAQAVARQESGKVMRALDEREAGLQQRLAEVKQANDQAATQLNDSLTGVKGDVGAVRTEVAQTRTELQQTASELKRAVGDMGVMSGLIATNGKELDALRRLGERDYIEFQLTKSKQPQKVGDIQLTLRKADLKRNRFTMQVMADDRVVEKKDRTINEPVQFYTGAARQPYELVVNQMNKDQVSGYLAIPKVRQTASNRVAPQ